MGIQESKPKQFPGFTEDDVTSETRPAKPAPFSDIDLDQWRNYSDMITDSLWLLGSRDQSSVHTAEYWGNFVPQIPHQAIRRFTIREERVLDLFIG